MPKTQAKRGMSPRELDALRKRYVAEQKQADSASKWQLANDIVSGINDIVGRGVIAPILGMPGDINQAIYDAGAFVNNKIKDVEVATGMVKQPRYVQPTQGNAYLGSEDIGSRMQQAGLVSSERRPMTELAASLVSPSAAAKTAINAPKTAINALRMVENLEAPSRGVRTADGMYIPRGQVGAIDQNAIDALFAPGMSMRKISDTGFDPRFDPRKKEQNRLNALTLGVEKLPMQEAKPVSLVDYEGYPFITSMSDRTAAGERLLRINDVDLATPVNQRGGQDFMRENPGLVWASGKNPSNQIVKMAKQAKNITGKDPLYVPWRMAPTGGDFYTGTGETMLSYAASAMDKKTKATLDRSIKQFIPDWAGVGTEKGTQQFIGAKDQVRKKIKNMMDKEFRDKGGLSIGEARLSVSDPTQLNAQTGGLMNVGRIFANEKIVPNSGHPSYPFGVPGEGLGRLDKDIGVYQMLQDAVKNRGIADPTNPSQSDIRALQMKPYFGIITEDLLKSLGY